MREVSLHRNMVTLALLVALCAAAVGAQEPPLKSLPGYFPFEELGILGRDELSLEVNLARPLLRLVAAATRGAEPEFADLVASLDAVRLRVAPAEDVDLKRVRGAVGEAADWLEDKGWSVVVRAREDDEEIFIYTRDLEGEIVGMAILVIEEGGDVAVINIVGRIDLAQLEKLGEALDIPQLGLSPEEPAESEKSEPSIEEPASDEDPL